MAEFPQMKLQQKVSQNMSQVQTQKMSQTQIMSLNLLSLSSTDLRNEIYSKAARNPALEITADSFETGTKNAVIRNNSHFSDNLYYGKATKAQSDASDAFQEALESNPDFRETLTEHLEHQLNAMNLSERKARLCRKLIYNLDEKGFHILAPAALTDKSVQDDKLLQECLETVQNLDPVGTCTANFEESLLIQAKIKGGASPCTIFLLQHFDFLNPPQIPKIQKKIKQFVEDQTKLKFNSFKPFEYDEEDIEDSLLYIKTLDPFPAQAFGSSQTAFVFPDIKIIRSTDENNNPVFSVALSKEIIPSLAVAKDYEELVKNTKVLDGDTSSAAEKLKSEIRFAKNSINDAKVFIESIEYREATILKAFKVIVQIQKDFFEKGPRYLVPLRQKDVADAIGVHETTVSRMANSKYVLCSWGIFPASYFFSNAVSPVKKQVDAPDSEQSGFAVENGSTASQTAGSLSKEAVKAVIADILEEHKNDKKALSDQKLSDALAEKGIKVARRTVAKYRGELNISSSYER